MARFVFLRWRWRWRRGRIVWRYHGARQMLQFWKDRGWWRRRRRRDHVSLARASHSLVKHCTDSLRLPSVAWGSVVVAALIPKGSRLGFPRPYFAGFPIFATGR